MLVLTLVYLTHRLGDSGLLLELFAPLRDHFVQRFLDQEEQVALFVRVVFFQVVLFAAHLHLAVHVRLPDHLVFELDVLPAHVYRVFQSLQSSLQLEVQQLQLDLFVLDQWLL